MTKTNYTTVCDKCYQSTWYETEQPCKRIIFKGCVTCGSLENISKEQKCTGTLRVIDTSNLDERFAPYYMSAERVEVEYNDGAKARFYVAKTTGWKPCYIEISKANSIGGMPIDTREIKSIRGLNKFR